MGSGYTDLITRPFYDALCNLFSHFFNQGNILLKHFQKRVELILKDRLFRELS